MRTKIVVACPPKLFYSVADRNVFEMTEKNKSFRSECLKVQAKNTVAASFNTTVGQMTEIFQ